MYKVSLDISERNYVAGIGAPFPLLSFHFFKSNLFELILIIYSNVSVNVKHEFNFEMKRGMKNR